MAQYTEESDNTIITLYKGKFVNGYFEDYGGEAWEITRNIGGNYMYRVGPFSEGESKNRKEIKYNLSISDINQYIEGEKLDCPLKWDINALGD